MHSRLERCALLSVLVWLPATGILAQDTGARAVNAATTSELSFLAGCWAGRMGSLDMREQWTEEEAGTMLWTTRFFRDGRLADFEFGMVVQTDEGVTMWPYPRGERSENGFPLVSTGVEYVFENLEHDYPVRIIYVRDGEDALAPRIEGRDGEARRWRLERVECPGPE